MFVAGTDTTSATLEWVVAELARHLHVMKKAQKEVRGIVGSKGTVEESDIDQFHYMRAVVMETLRFHPPVPLLVPRESIKACVIDGFEIPAGTRVLVNTLCNWEGQSDMAESTGVQTRKVWRHRYRLQWAA